MASKPSYLLDLPESVKPLPAQSGADSNAVPHLDNRVYPASDLLKLAPTSLKDKMKSLVTSEEVTEDSDTKQNTKSDATAKNASEIETETTTDKAGQTTTERENVKLETVEAMGNQITEGAVATADPLSSAAADIKPKEESTVATGGTADGEKKKKKKRTSKRTNPDGTLKPPKVKATGFEEFYCEDPIHPDVYAEEVNTVYHR